MLESTPPSGYSLVSLVSGKLYQFDRRYIRKGNFESLLDILEHLLVVVVADEGDRQTLRTETTGTTDTVQVGVGVRGHVVVDGKVDPLDIDTTAEHVGGHTDTLVELLELLVAFDTEKSSAIVQIEQIQG